MTRAGLRRWDSSCSRRSAPSAATAVAAAGGGFGRDREGAEDRFALIPTGRAR